MDIAIHATRLLQDLVVPQFKIRKLLDLFLLTNNLEKHIVQ